MQRKLYHLRSHSWITIPDHQTGLSKLGLTDYALKFFLRFSKMNISDYPKTKYGINNSTLIKLFLKETKTKYDNDKLLKERRKMDWQQQLSPQQKDSLTFSEKIQYDRFLIKRNQPFAMLNTLQYDIEMTAPVDMRVVDQNFDMFYYNKFLTAPYLFEIECLNMSQLQDLISEEQYAKSSKFFEYC